MFKKTYRGVWITAGILTVHASIAAAAEVTYSKEISRLIAAHCQECHQPKGIAPFEMLTYNDVRGWAKMIREVVSEDRMPPWFAEPNHLEFSNDVSLSADEKAMLLGWIDGGMPRGDEADLPEPRVFETSWRMGTPEKVFQQPEEYTIPAEGLVDYQYFMTDPGFEEDVWVSGLECLPGNPKVVHHIIIYAIPPGKQPWEMDAVFNSFDDASSGEPKTREAFQDWGSLYVAGFAPGTPPVVLEEGVARRIPAGTRFLWEVHYTPIGKVEKDRSQFGINFAKGPVRSEYITVTPGNSDFVIPAGAARHKVEARTSLPEDAYIHAFTPHMHYRGASFVYNFTYPDGREEIPLHVPRYDFNWQLSYQLKEPLFVPKGTKIHCVAHFDNSTGNPRNPNPNVDVYPGEQTTEEMMIGFMDITWASGRPSK